MIFTENRTHGKLVIDLGEPWVHDLKGTTWLEFPVQYHRDDGILTRSIWTERTEHDDVVIAEARYWAANLERGFTPEGGEA